MMDSAEKKRIAFRMTVRAAEVLCNIENCINEDNTSQTDTSKPRTIFILLCYSFELILKSRMVVRSTVDSLDKVDNDLRDPKHDFKKIVDIVSRFGELKNLGIYSIIEKQEECGERRKHPKHTYYIVTTTDRKQFRIENFNDIRYDFLCDRRRCVPRYQEITDTIKEIDRIFQKVKVLNTQDKE